MKIWFNYIINMLLQIAATFCTFHFKVNLLNELLMLNKIFFFLAQYTFTGTNSEYIFSPRIINFYCGLIAQMKIQMAPFKQNRRGEPFQHVSVLFFCVRWFRFLLNNISSLWYHYNKFLYSKWPWSMQNDFLRFAKHRIWLTFKKWF